MNFSTSPDIWIGALLTLSVFSLLYKNNVVWKIAQSLFVGVSVGYVFSVWVVDVLEKRTITPLLNGDFKALVPIFLGMLMLFSVSKKHSKKAFIPIAFVVSFYLVINLIFYVQTYLISQIQASFVSLIVLNKNGTLNLLQTINSFIKLIGIVSVSTYFYYFPKKNKKFYTARQIGSAYIMVAFGTAFGYTVLSTIVVFIDRLRFLLDEWMGFL